MIGTRPFRLSRTTSRPPSGEPHVTVETRRAPWLSQHCRQAHGIGNQAVAESVPATTKKLGNEYFVIDGDRHTVEPLEAFTKYLDPDFRKWAPKLVEDEHGGTRAADGRAPVPETTGLGNMVGREGNADYRPRGESLGQRRRRSEHVFVNARRGTWTSPGVDVGLWIPTAGCSCPTSSTVKSSTPSCVPTTTGWARDFAVGDRHLWCATIPIVPEWAVDERSSDARRLGANAVWMRPNVMQEVSLVDRGVEIRSVGDGRSGSSAGVSRGPPGHTTRLTARTTSSTSVYWMAHSSIPSSGDGRGARRRHRLWRIRAPSETQGD